MKHDITEAIKNLLLATKVIIGKHTFNAIQIYIAGEEIKPWFTKQHYDHFSKHGIYFSSDIIAIILSRKCIYHINRFLLAKGHEDLLRTSLQHLVQKWQRHLDPDYRVKHRLIFKPDTSSKTSTIKGICLIRKDR